jgi:hypothetical protein
MVNWTRIKRDGKISLYYALSAFVITFALGGGLVCLGVLVFSFYGREALGWTMLLGSPVVIYVLVWVPYMTLRLTKWLMGED